MASTLFVVVKKSNDMVLVYHYIEYGIMQKFEKCENYNKTQLTHNKYKTMQAQEIVELSNQHHLEKKEKEALVKCLAEYKDPFKGQVENLEGIQVKFELKKGVEPFHAKPYSVPIAHLPPLKQAIQEMVKIRSLYHPQKIQNRQHQHFVCPRKIREFM